MGMKPPQRPEDIFEDLTADLSAALGTDLLGASVFGSAASGRYKPGSSDINLLVLAADEASDVAGRLAPVAKKWQPARVAAPLIMTPEYVAGSLDVFPIEFLVMSRANKCIHGQDALAGLKVQPRHLRLQLERELKAKLVALNTRYMTSGGEERHLRQLVAEALPAFTALFQAYLQLTAGQFPLASAEVMEQAQRQGLEINAFSHLAAVRAGDHKVNARELRDLVRQAIDELAAICRQVDQLTPGDGQD